MTRKILEPEEWPRLAETALGEVWHHLQPDRTRVLVVEDDDGEIIGCWAFLMVLHAEGVWIHPDHRGRSGVARQLMRGFRDVAQYFGSQTVWTGSDNAEVARLCDHLGGQRVPFDSVILPLVKGES